MARNLAVCVLGNRNSGKSYTWNTLFDRVVRTGNELRRLEFTDEEYIDVFLVSGSPEERQSYVGDIITVEAPRIVLCSLQYREDVIDTLDYFSARDYFLYVHWLNPGYEDEGQKYDSLGLLQRLSMRESLIGIRSGKIDPRERVREIRAFLYGWSHDRRLIKRIEPLGSKD